jgi:hypothetical protein
VRDGDCSTLEELKTEMTKNDTSYGWTLGFDHADFCGRTVFSCACEAFNLPLAEAVYNAYHDEVIDDPAWKDGRATTIFEDSKPSLLRMWIRKGATVLTSMFMMCKNRRYSRPVCIPDVLKVVTWLCDLCPLLVNEACCQTNETWDIFYGASPLWAYFQFMCVLDQKHDYVVLRELLKRGAEFSYWDFKSWTMASGVDKPSMTYMDALSVCSSLHVKNK